MLVSAVLTSGWIGVAAPVQAFSLVTGRTALNGNDLLDWSMLGPVPSPAPFKILPNTITTTSQGGVGVTVGIPATTVPGITPPLLFQTAANTIPTNFASGDFVLFTGLLPGQFPAPGNPGPLTLLFDTPVTGAGAQIAVDDTLQFMAFIAAYDRNNTLLGSFSVPGTSSLALDNSALFLGVLSDTPNIARIVYSTSESDRAIGLNKLSLNTSAAVPEPSSMAAMALAGFGLFAARQRKSQC